MRSWRLMRRPRRRCQRYKLSPCFSVASRLASTPSRRRRWGAAETSRRSFRHDRRRRSRVAGDHLSLQVRHRREAEFSATLHITVFHGIPSWAIRVQVQGRAPSRARGGLISASFPRELRRLRARSERAGRRHVRRRRFGFLSGVSGGRHRRGRRRGPARQRRRPGVRPERTGGRQGRAFRRARARPGLWPSSRRHRRRVRLLGGVAPERPRLARLRLDWLPRLGGEARPLERLARRHGLARRRRGARPAGRKADLAR